MLFFQWQTLESLVEDSEDSHKFYECDPLPLFELGAIKYEQYLLNIRLPSFFNNDTTNKNIGKLEGLEFVVRLCLKYQFETG